MGNYKVYKHTFPNNKVYIGMTKQNPYQRWKNGHGYCKQLRVYNAILKYGWDNINHEILFENLTYEEACEKEILLIALYKSNNENFGYNIEKGGSSQREMSEETRHKIGEKARINNLKRPLEFYQAIGNKNRGKKHSETTKQMITESCIRASKHLNKPVAMVNVTTGEIVATFDSSYRAAKYINPTKALINTASKIRECCNGKRKTRFGYSWQFIDGKGAQNVINIL